MIRAFVLALVLSFATLAAQPADAQVRVSFHSRELGSTFPHAFFTFEGTLSDGTPVPLTGYGFTAQRLSIALLSRPVDGMLEYVVGRELARGTRHFSVTVDDAGYGRMLDVVERWRTRAQPSYDLDKANCIHFVMEVADTLGLDTNPDTRFTRRPRAFTTELQSLNEGVVEAATD